MALLLAVAVLGAGALAGCGDSGTDSTETSTSSTTSTAVSESDPATDFTPIKKEVSGCLSANGFFAVSDLGGTPFTTASAYGSGGTVVFAIFNSPTSAQRAATQFGGSGLELTTEGTVVYGAETGTQLQRSEGQAFVKCLFNP